MRFYRKEILNIGYADSVQLHDAKQEKENLRHMLTVTHNKDYTFPDGSIFSVTEAKSRIKELTYNIIPQLYKEMTETRNKHLESIINL